MACAIHNTTPTAICKAIGLSEAAATRWKRGSKPHDTTIKKIADHLGVSVFYFMGEDLHIPTHRRATKEEIESAFMITTPKENSQPDSETQTIIDQLTETLSQLTVEELKEIDRYVDYLVNRKK